MTPVVSSANWNQKLEYKEFVNQEESHQIIEYKEFVNQEESRQILDDEEWNRLLLSKVEFTHEQSPYLILVTFNLQSLDETTTVTGLKIFGLLPLLLGIIILSLFIATYVLINRPLKKFTSVVKSLSIGGVSERLVITTMDEMGETQQQSEKLQTQQE